MRSHEPEFLVNIYLNFVTLMGIIFQTIFRTLCFISKRNLLFSCPMILGNSQCSYCLIAPGTLGSEDLTVPWNSSGGQALQAFL